MKWYCFSLATVNWWKCAVVIVDIMVQPVYRQRTPVAITSAAAGSLARVTASTTGNGTTLLNFLISAYCFSCKVCIFEFLLKFVSFFLSVKWQAWCAFYDIWMLWRTFAWLQLVSCASWKAVPHETSLTLANKLWCKIHYFLHEQLVCSLLEPEALFFDCCFSWPVVFLCSSKSGYESNS